MNQQEFEEQKKGIEKSLERMKNTHKGLEEDFKDAEESLRGAVEEAEQIALKKVQEEVDKLFSSTGVRARIDPKIVRKVLSSIVKHVKGIYFANLSDIQEKIAKKEVTYEDCQRELRQCVLFNYWSMKKFKNHLKLSRIYEANVDKLVEENKKKRSRKKLADQFIRNNTV